jgi:hypothetical protein
MSISSILHSPTHIGATRAGFPTSAPITARLTEGASEVALTLV